MAPRFVGAQVGLPAYGRRLDNPGEVKTWSELAEKGPVDMDQDVVDGYWINGPRTVQQKTKWALETGLAGIMVWECGQDSFDPDKSLLGFIAAAAEEHRD